MSAFRHILGLLCLTSAIVSSNGLKTSHRQNPIRKIVTLMQNMQKEIEAEGVKEKELFDKFMCFCETGQADLAKAADDAKAQNEAATTKHDASTSEKAQLEEDIKTHKADMEAAQADLAKATNIRDKEKAEFDETLATKSASDAALASAIPAIEKGMAGGSLLQFVGKKSMRQLKRAILNSQTVTSDDRSDIKAFLQGQTDGPGSGEILGMLKAMKDELGRDIATLTKNEEAAVKGFGDMSSSKEKEIEFADESIESKKERVGTLAVEIVQLKDEIEDSANEATESEKMGAALAKQCAEKKKDYDAASKSRADEMAAVGEAISILTDDDALDVFKKAAPSSFVQDSSSSGGYGFHHHRNMFTGELVFLQVKSSTARAVDQAQRILASHAVSNRGGLMLFTLKSKLRHASGAASRGAVDFSEILKMIDQMVEVLKSEGKDDMRKKDFCVADLDKTDREKMAAEDKLSNVQATIEEITGNIDTVSQGIADLEEGIKSLDRDVAQATEQRKQEHAEYATNVQMQEVAIEIVGKAKNRLNKFYNPSAYKAPPKKELSQEDKLLAGGASALVQTESNFDQPEASELGAVSFAQVSARIRQEPPALAQYAKNEKSGGVVALMDTMIADLKAGAQEARFMEKQAQAEYVELMENSQTKRAQDQKSLVDQGGAKAELEEALTEAKENQALTMDELENVQKTLSELHGSCDFLLKNFEMRLEARGAEIEGLQNAKATLSGANLS